jgi:Na+-driven multidrug efflux pump
MIAIGVPALIIGLCTFPFVGSQMIAVSFFQAIRKPRASMTISLTRQLLFLIPMLIILPHLIGVTGVWWSMALADVASVTISWVMLYTETKKFSL